VEELPDAGAASREKKEKKGYRRRWGVNRECGPLSVLGSSGTTPRSTRASKKKLDLGGNVRKALG